MPKEHVRQLSSIELDDLLQQPGLSIDSEISRLTSTVARNLPNGCVLLVFSDGAVLWESRGHLLDALQSANTRTEPQHLLFGRQPYGKEFPSHVPDLLEKLADLLRLPRRALDCSWHSLIKVDKIIRELFFPEERVSVAIFAPVVAYLGEVIRAAYGGEWKMRLHSDEATWEPWLLVSDTVAFMPFLDAYTQLYDRPEGCLSIVSPVPYPFEEKK